MTLPLFAERYGATVASAACTVETTKKALGDAIRPYALERGLPIGAEVDAAIKAIRGEGGVIAQIGKSTVKEIAGQVSASALVARSPSVRYGHAA